MFLADGDIYEFYSKNSKINNQKDVSKTIFKRKLCQFIIPDSCHRSKIFENVSQCEENDVLFDANNGWPLPNEINLSNYINYNSAFKSQNNKNLSQKNTLASLPQLHQNKSIKTVSELSSMKEETGYNSPIAQDSPASVDELNIHLSTENKIDSKRNFTCNFQRSRLNSSLSHETLSSSSCSLFTVNSSAIKRESCDELLANSPLEMCSSSSVTNAINVDIDIDIMVEKERCKIIQPFVVLERLRLKKYLKRKELTTFEHISNKSFRNNKDKRDSISEYFEGVYRKVNRVTDSDEETIPATDEQSSGIYHFREIKTEIHYPLPSSLKDDPIYCFKCKVDLKTFCDKHPVERITNVNIDCPYIEYMTGESYDKCTYLSVVEDCCCKQNELDHIQRSLPDRFKLRESKVSELGIWTTCTVLQGCIIGPYLGEVVECCSSNKLKRNPYKTRHAFKNGNFFSCIESAFKSNWLRCINFSNNQDKINLKVIHHDQKVYFQALKDLESDQELLIFKKVQH